MVLLGAGGGWRQGRTGADRVDHEVVVHDLALAVGRRLGVEHELGLDRRRDVVLVVRVAGEVELRGEQLVVGRRHLEVQVGGAPGVPAGGGDELAARTVGGDLVGGGDDRVDLEATLVVGGEAAAEVPVRQAWGVLAVEAVRVGLPQLDLGVGEGGAVRLR